MMDEPVRTRCVGAGMRLRLFVTVLGVLLALGFLYWPSATLADLPDAPAPESPITVRDKAQLEAAASESGSAEREAVGISAKEESATLSEASDPNWTSIAEREKDPIERGNCSLFLRLADAETGEPLAGRIELWRIAAPANENWSAGDQLQATAVVKTEGTEFARLPAGAYRAICLGAAEGAEYADEFSVGGSLTKHTLLVHAVREIALHLELFDIHGYRIEEATIKRRGYSRRNRDLPRPEWRVERESLRGLEITVRGGGGGFGGRSSQTWNRAQAEEHGFALGAFLQSSRSKTRSYRFGVRIAGRGEIEFEIELHPQDGGHFVGVFVSEADALAQLVLPDGRTADDPDVDTLVKSVPVPRKGRPALQAWQESSIEMVVLREKFASWTRSWRPSEGTLVDRYLTEEER